MNRYKERLCNEISDELAKLESALDIFDRPPLGYFFGKIKQLKRKSLKRVIGVIMGQCMVGKIKV